MSERIVDGLEAVQVDHQTGTAGPPVRRIFQGIAQGFVEHASIGQLRERVVAGEIGDLLRRFPLFGHIGPDTAEPLVIADIIHNGRT